MSDSIDKTNEETASKPESKEEAFVAKTAYENVSKDMHKYKDANKSLKAMVNQLQAEKEAGERAKMEEKQQFEELYKKAQAEKEELLSKVNAERTQLARQRKMAALKAEVGNIKDVYLNLANVDSIELDENGSINSESVLAVANDFKKEHPSLIPSTTAGNITSHASPIGNVASSKKDIKDMTVEELQAQLRNQ